MKTEVINVTPHLAAEWLMRNTSNRPLRRGAVEALKTAFMRGEYIQTHQGIAFSASGELLDGQHRLTAISEMRDGSFPMNVSRGVPDDAYRVTDIGVKRSAADSLREEDRRLVEAARLIAVLCIKERRSITPISLMPIIEEIRAPHNQLLAFCPTVSKTWSCAAFRVAAVYSMLAGEDRDYVKSVYWALVHLQYDAMPASAKALCRAHANGAIRASNVNDTLARAMVVFSQRKGGVTKIQIANPSEYVDRVRGMFGHLVLDVSEIQKKAAHEGAAKGNLPRKFIRAA